jgi:hypothetical protein
MSTKWLAQLRGPKQWKAEDARRVLGAWKESGESMAGFAYRHGLNAQRIAWWRDRLPAPTPSPTPSLTLVPVTLRATPVALSSSAAVSLMVGGAVRVEVADASRVPPLWFAAVVEALSRRGA